VWCLCNVYFLIMHKLSRIAECLKTYMTFVQFLIAVNSGVHSVFGLMYLIGLFLSNGFL